MKNKAIVISTIVCLLPIILSLVLYDRLPQEIAVHFTSSGTPDVFLPKILTAFGIPVLFAILNLYSHFRVDRDPRNENASNSLKLLSKWLIPVVSVVLVPITLFMSMGTYFPINMIAQALAGVVIIICGNYLPKCRRNYTIGIKLPWTLDSDENWNKTHRFAGFVWVIGGICILINSFLSLSWIITIVVLVILVILPFLYSYAFYSKQHKEVK